MVKRKHSREAIAEFHQCFFEFQSDLPSPIVTEVSDENYDRLPQLLGVLRPILAEHELSVYWKGWSQWIPTGGTGTKMVGECVLRHRMGYGQTASFAVYDVEATFPDMIPAHQICSAESMIKRITLESVCGISTWAPQVERGSVTFGAADMQSANNGPYYPEKLKELKKHWRAVHCDLPRSAKAEEVAKVFYAWVQESGFTPTDDTQWTDDMLDTMLQRQREAT